MSYPHRSHSRRSSVGDEPVVSSPTGSAGPVPPYDLDSRSWPTRKVAPSPVDETLPASLASLVTFLAGVWLIVAPIFLTYTDTGGGFNGYQNDMVIGIAIALLALVRALATRHVPWLSMANVALGAWLVIAPFVLGYQAGADAPQAVTNDIVVGVIVIVAATTSTVLTYRQRAHDQ